MTARILDRGYRRYRGPRTGVRGAIRTVVGHSCQRALGLRRSAGAKVWPVLAVAASYLPAIVFVGVVSLIPDADAAQVDLPTYGEYYFFVQSAVAIFVAFVAPELLCTDRRTGMLGIYLASPLDRDSYLAAKAIATALLLGLITIGPPMLMLVAFILQENGPDGPGGVARTLLRVVLAGSAITVLFTAVSMAFSSLTDRKAFATIGVVMVLLGSSATIGTLRSLGFPDALVALDLVQLSLAMAEKVHGETTHFAAVPTAAVVLGALAWTALGVLVTRSRYQRLQVTR